MTSAHSIKPSRIAALIVAALSACASSALALRAAEVNAVGFADRNKVVEPGPNPLIVKAQVLLSRRSVSPGVIDGVDGESLRKAVCSFRR